MDAFIYYTGPGGAAEEFKDIGYWVNIMKTVDFVGQTSVGDAILVRHTTRNWPVGLTLPADLQVLHGVRPPMAHHPGALAHLGDDPR